MNLDQQRKLDTFVNREIIMLASHLVEDLLKISMYGEKSYGGVELDNIENFRREMFRNQKDFENQLE